MLQVLNFRWVLKGPFLFCGQFSNFYKYQTTANFYHEICRMWLSIIRFVLFKMPTFWAKIVQKGAGHIKKTSGWNVKSLSGHTDQCF